MALRAGYTMKLQDWISHLMEMEIPECYAKEYAPKFFEQQVQKRFLKFISDDELRETFGVSLIGHRLAIKNHFEEVKAQSSSISPITHNPRVRHQPPQLKPVMNPSSFRAFTEHWAAYKQLVGIPDDSKDAAAQIFSLACTDHPEIRRMIADHKSDHRQLSEVEYIRMLRNLLTAKATPEAYRNKLFYMKQDPSESCQQWLNRLQEISPDCEFTIPCDQKEGVFHNFDDTILRTKFVLGLHNTHIKKDILSRSNLLPTLDAVYTQATCMEATSHDLNNSSSANTVAEIYTNNEQPSSEDDELYRISSYKKLHKSQKGKGNGITSAVKIQKEKPCIGCGSTNHASSDRPSKCPAWRKTCNQCKKKGHFIKVCRSQKEYDFANAVIAEIHEGNHNNEISVQIAPQGFSSTKEASVKVFPDTGATICVAGVFILRLLKIKISQLKPTSRIIKTATGNKINCIGWFRALLSIDQYKTTQDIYVCKSIQKVYLSKAGCIALRMVHKEFPKPLPMLMEDDSNTSPTISAQLPHRPENIPFPPTLENIPKLKKYLLDAFSSTAFNDSKDGIFPKMQRVPEAYIHVGPDTKPYFRGTPNTIPYFWREGAKELVDQFEAREIIAKTEIGTPAKWCFPMVITAKKSNTLKPKLRMTIDFQHLNSQCTRELHHVESPFKLASQIPTNTFKTLLDAVDGYQAIPLAKESQPLTNFITPWGPYHWLRVPAGLIDSGDKYTSRYDKIIQHIPRKVKCVDDTLLYDTTISDAFFHTFDYLHKCASHGIVFNSSKFKFCQREVVFAGFTVTPTGLKPSPSTLKAISEFPTPQNTTDVRSWFGLVRQVAYAHSVSESLAPLRSLLQHKGKENPKFVWNDQLQQAFEQSKEHIVNAVKDGIKSFDPQKLTCIQSDWSRSGIGFLLLQKHCLCNLPSSSDTCLSPCCESGWKLVFAGSRFTTDAESRYAPTEGEATAVAWALKSCRLFILGCPKLMVVTDHKPLLGILNNRDLGSIKNPRLSRIKEHTLEYDFEIRYCPGKLHVGADALSRHPTGVKSTTSQCSDESSLYENHVESIVDYAINSICSTIDSNSNFPQAVTLEKVEVACLQDCEYMELHNLVMSGFPEHRANVPAHARIYLPFAQKGMLSTYGSIILFQDRPIIPKCLRTYIMRVLHSAHQGCTGMIARAQSSIYWPGIRKDVLHYQSNCRTCLEIAPSQAREPLITSVLPERPFQVICADFFQVNQRFYLIVVDRFSGFLHIFFSQNAPSNKFVEKHLRDIFVRYGRPERLDTDGGLQFQAESLKKFLKTWGVEHRISSPYYPQSNGRAEIGVRTAKRLLKENSDNGTLNNDKVACAILNYHNTPLRDTPMSPAQLLFGRQLADFLPVNPKEYQLHPYWIEQMKKRRVQRSIQVGKQAKRYNIGTRTLQPLVVGQHVIIQNQTTRRWDRTAVILEVLPHRKYKLQLDDTGNISFRNRRFLKPCRSTAPEPTVSYPVPIAHTSETHSPREGERTEDTSPDQNEVTEQSVELQEVPRSTLPESTSTVHPRTPLALRRLRPHNKRGFKEQ